MRPGARRSSRISVPDAAHPGRSSSRRGPAGTGSLASTSEHVELLEVHQVVHAGEQQPLPAAQPTHLRVVQRAGLGLVAGDGPRGALHDTLALGDLAQQGLAVHIRCAGDALDDRRGIRAASDRPPRATPRGTGPRATRSRARCTGRRSSRPRRPALAAPPRGVPRRSPSARPRVSRAAATIPAAVPSPGSMPDLPAHA